MLKDMQCKKLKHLKIDLIYVLRAFSEDVNFGRMKFQNHQSDFDLRLIPIYGKDNHSYVFCSWINKMEKKIYIHHDPKAIEALYAKIKYYNDICEDDRNWDNQDEEPEDEISLLT